MAAKLVASLALTSKLYFSGAGAPIASIQRLADADASALNLERHSTKGHELIQRAKPVGYKSREGDAQAETVFLDLGLCFNFTADVVAIEFFVEDVAAIHERRFNWRILHPIPSNSYAATQWFRLGDAWPVLSPGTAAGDQMPLPGAYRATLTPRPRLSFGDCLGWSLLGEGDGPLPFDDNGTSRVAWATSSDGLHDAVELFVKSGVDKLSSAERKTPHIGWTGLERRTYSIRMLFEPVEVPQASPSQAALVHERAPAVEGGNPACWRGGYTFERCCRADSDGSCWDSSFTYERCCSLTAVKRYAEFDFTPPDSPHFELRHLLRDNQPRLGPVQDDEALLLFALVRAMRPRTVVEFGTSNGFSAINWLHALHDDPDARIYSYDILPYPSARALEDADPRFVFLQKSQADFEPADVEGRSVDVAFFDAGHLVEYSLMAFERVRSSLSPNALVAVHDTGLHVLDFGSGAPAAEEGLPFSSESCARRQGGAARCHRFPGCAGSSDQHGNCVGRAHRPSERQFVQELLERWPEFRPIYVHSRRVFRHGLTLLQSGDLLSSETPAGVF